MADIKMPKSVPCKFDAKGWAPCKIPSTNGWCSKHEKSKCVLCGERAVRSCDAAMGGLCCGVNLCENCQHSLESDGHVNKLVYEIQLRDLAELEENGKESSRMLALRGVPTHVPLPSNLEELLSGNWEGIFDLKICYFLKLRHGLMGTFPAILKDTKIAFITLDTKSLFRVWKSLRPCNSEIVVDSWMVNREIAVAYRMSSNVLEQRQSRPYKLFSRDEVEALFAENPHPFGWAPGLIGAGISQERFDELINQTAV